MPKIDILTNRHEYKFLPALSVHAAEPVWIKTIQHRDYPGWVLKKFAAIRHDDMIEMIFFGKSPDGRWFQSITQMAGALWDDKEILLGPIIKHMIFGSMQVFLDAQNNASD